MASHKEEEKPLLVRTREEVSWHRGGGGGEGGVEEPTDLANASASQGIEPVHENKGKKAGGRCGRWASGGTLRFVIRVMGGVQRSEEEKERVRPAGQPS